MTGMDRRRFLSALGRAGLATWTLTSTPAWARAAVTKAAKVAKPPPPPAELIERNARHEHELALFLQRHRCRPPQK